MTTVKVLTITLNPSVDIAYYVDDFSFGGIHRTKRYEKTPGGKGINVAKVLKILGADVTATGFIGGHSGRYVVDELEAVGIRCDFLAVPVSTRNCISIHSDNVTTEINEESEVVDDSYRHAFMDHLKDHVQYDFIVLSGSCLQGIERSIYVNIIRFYNRAGVNIIVDVDATTLSSLIDEDVEIFMIKPNEDERVALLHEDDLVAPKNVSYCIVSYGDRGLAEIKKTSIFVTAPNVLAINPIGSGDASIAGFIVGYDLGIPHALKSMVAAGTANAMEYKTGHIEKENYVALLNEVQVSDDETVTQTD